MRAFLQDLRQAWRGLRRAPGYTAIALTTLVLGIAATTAIYTVVERVVLDPLPYPEADRLIRLRSAVPGVEEGTEWQLSLAQYVYFGGHAQTIEELGGYTRGGANVQTSEGAQRVVAAQATASLLRLIGARAVRGRVIQEPDDDPGAPQVALLSHEFWRRFYGGDASVVGRTILLYEQPIEVVGVLEPGTALPDEPGGSVPPPDVWVPLQLNEAGPFYNAHVAFSTIGRLAPGATLAAAQAELDRLTTELPAAFPQVYSATFMTRTRFTTKAYALKNFIVGDVAQNLWIVLGGVGFVLLIACANVANLFLVRIEGRRRELAVRVALGAGRVALVRQFLAESLALALSAGAVALVLGFWAVEWLVAVAPPSIPRLAGLRLDGSVALASFGISLLVALLLALLPVLRYGVRGTTELVEGGRSVTVGRERQRVRSVLVVSQVALALVLLVAAGLLLESFQRLRGVDPGIRADGVVTMQLHLPPSQRYGTMMQQWQFYRALDERLRALPGVTAVGVTSDLPFGGGFGCTVQGFEDARVQERLRESNTTTCAGQEPTTPGYIEALGIPLLAGRTLTLADLDAPAAGAVVVSRAFAERFWPGEDPIGKGVAPNGRTEPPFYHVVGVVGDVRASSVDEPPAIAIYYPLVPIPDTGRWWLGSMNLVVRTRLANPLSLLPAIRAAVADLDPAVPLSNVEEMSAIVTRSLSRLSFTTTLLGLASAVALLLAVVGLYGVISYVVARRTNEIGVRVALGARPRQVARMVVGDSLKLVGSGLALGFIAAVILTRVLRGLLYDVQPTQPFAYAAAIALLTSAGLLGSWLPARRAARVDPILALREE